MLMPAAIMLNDHKLSLVLPSEVDNVNKNESVIYALIDRARAPPERRLHSPTFCDAHIALSRSVLTTPSYLAGLTSSTTAVQDEQ
jgi:hypothetical protein